MKKFFKFFRGFFFILFIKRIKYIEVECSECSTKGLVTKDEDFPAIPYHACFGDNMTASKTGKYFYKHLYKKDVITVHSKFLASIAHFLHIWITEDIECPECAFVQVNPYGERKLRKHMEEIPDKPDWCSCKKGEPAGQYYIH